jgi:hypothetical protein
MATLEITNALKNTSIIRVVDVGTVTINIADLTKNVKHETVVTADIKKLMWTTNGSISITRNSISLMNLHNTGEFSLNDISHSIANNNASAIVVTITTGGTLFLEVSKFATYNVDISVSTTGF